MANYLNPSNWFNRSEKIEPAAPVSEVEKELRKAKFLDGVTETRSQKTDQIAVSTYDPDELKSNGFKKDTLDCAFAGYYGDEQYNNMMSFNYNDDKYKRLQEYRKLGEEEMIEACIHELATSCMASHDKEPPVKVNLNGNYDDTVVDNINKEMEKVISYFKFEKNGQKYFRDFFTTGEVAFENVFSLERPELGLLDVKYLMPEELDPVYRNFVNGDIAFFNYRVPQIVKNEHPHNRHNSVNQYQNKNIPMSRGQLTYFNSGVFETQAYGRNLISRENPFKVKPYIMRGFRANRRLDLIEDALTRNAIANGTDKLAWNIPVGNMEGPAVQNFMNKIINSFKRKKGISGEGQIYDQFNPNSIHEDYYFPVRQDGQTASVNRIAGSQAFTSFKDILNYFRERVYEKMQVPIARLNPDTTRSDGTTITAQEFAFSERIIQFQEMFAQAIKETLIVHLKLKGLKMHTESCQNVLIQESTANDTNPQEVVEDPDYLKKAHIDLIMEGYHHHALVITAVENGVPEADAKKTLGQSYWNQFDLLERDIDVEFSLPTNFLALREQQLMEIRMNTVNQKISTGVFAPELIMKETFGLSDDDLIKHREWNKSWAKHQWEISKLTESGPEFREIAAADAGIDGGGSGLGTSLGTGGSVGGDDPVPEFGDSEALDDVGSEPIDTAPEPDVPEPADTPPEPSEDIPPVDEI